MSVVHWLLQHQHHDVFGEAACMVVGVDEHPGYSFDKLYVELGLGLNYTV